MFSFSELLAQFTTYFKQPHFPQTPEGLYEPCNYFLGIGGKHIRPVSCLMGNELFGPIHPDAWIVATAIELFHNFTLIHDDIMDQSDLRRGHVTVHQKFGTSSAILSGDVMLIVAYEYLNKIHPELLQETLTLFNKTAKEVCEGQQMDMDFEQRETISLDEYIEMITLKTSVLLAASLSMGAFLGGASKENCDKIYEFGKNLGIGFQVQDDYLDAFGNSQKFGKAIGGDIRRNKKTFLLLYALENLPEKENAQLKALMDSEAEDKVEKVLALFRQTGVDKWAKELRQHYADEALRILAGLNVADERKNALRELTHILLQREV